MERRRRWAALDRFRPPWRAGSPWAAGGSAARRRTRWRRNGDCGLWIDDMAALAGVCRSSVRTRSGWPRARPGDRPGAPSPGRKRPQRAPHHQPGVAGVAPAGRAVRGARRCSGSIGCKSVPPTDRGDPQRQNGDIGTEERLPKGSGRPRPIRPNENSRGWWCGPSYALMVYGRTVWRTGLHDASLSLLCSPPAP